MTIITILKRLKWELSDEIGRFNHYNSILRLLPGRFGEDIRAKIIPKYFEHCGENIKIHEGVRFRCIHKLQVGDNVQIGVDNFIQASGGLTLGNNILLGPGVKVWSINHRFDDLTKSIVEQGYNRDAVIIGDGVWLGANVFVLPGVQIPEGCVVGACSVVTKKTYPPFSILVGNPCRVVGHRNLRDTSPKKVE